MKLLRISHLRVTPPLRIYRGQGSALLLLKMYFLGALVGTFLTALVLHP